MKDDQPESGTQSPIVAALTRASERARKEALKQLETKLAHAIKVRKQSKSAPDLMLREWIRAQGLEAFEARLVDVGKGKLGRPSKEAFAREAAALKKAGMKHPQIASELNKRHGPETTTSEAVRKLLRRYSDKT